MKEKIKRILIIIAEIGTIVWAVKGMWEVVTFQGILNSSFMGRSMYSIYRGAFSDGTNLLIMPLLFYFLSAVLILYLLRKYGRKN